MPPRPGSTHGKVNIKALNKHVLKRLLSETNYWERAAWPVQTVLLCADGTVLTENSYSYGTFMDEARQTIMEDVYYRRLMNASTTVTWMGVRDNPLVSHSRPQMAIAQNVVQNRKTVGILLCMVDAAYYSAMMSQGRISEISDVYLVSKDADLICAAGSSLERLEQLQQTGQPEQDERVSLGEEYLCLRRTLDFSDFGQQWELILLHPVKDLTKELDSMQTTMVAVGGLLILALLGVIVYINRAVLRPVVYYRRKIAQIGSDNFDVRIDVVGKDEVRDLGEGLNTMVGRIQTGVVKLKDRENALRKLEIQSLTAQINPHFIRNTLNSIRVMAENDRQQRRYSGLRWRLAHSE